MHHAHIDTPAGRTAGSGYKAASDTGDNDVIPWTVLDTAALPDRSGDLRLKQRGSEFSIMLGSNELMNSRLAARKRPLQSWSASGWFSAPNRAS